MTRARTRFRTRELRRALFLLGPAVRLRIPQPGDAPCEDFTGSVDEVLTRFVEDFEVLEPAADSKASNARPK